MNKRNRKRGRKEAHRDLMKRLSQEANAQRATARARRKAKIQRRLEGASKRKAGREGQGDRVNLPKIQKATKGMFGRAFEIAWGLMRNRRRRER